MTDAEERETLQMKSRGEVEEVLDLLKAAPREPDRITNAERRRTLLWVLDREDEAEEIGYENGVLPHSFR